MGFQFLLQTPARQLFNKVCQRTIQPPGTTYNTCISMYQWVTIIDASVLPVSSDGKWTDLLAAPTKTCYFKVEPKLKMSSGNHRCNDATITWHVFFPPHFKKKLKIFWGGKLHLGFKPLVGCFLWPTSENQHYRHNLYMAHVSKVAATAVASAFHLCAYKMSSATILTVGHLQLGSNQSTTVTVVVH